MVESTGFGRVGNVYEGSSFCKEFIDVRFADLSRAFNFWLCVQFFI